MVSFMVIICCNICNEKRELVVFNNLIALGRIEIPTSQLKCTTCNVDDSSVLLVGPGQPEFRETNGAITALG